MPFGQGNTPIKEVLRRSLATSTPTARYKPLKDWPDRQTVFAKYITTWRFSLAPGSDNDALAKDSSPKCLYPELLPRPRSNSDNGRAYAIGEQVIRFRDGKDAYPLGGVALLDVVYPSTSQSLSASFRFCRDPR